MRQLEERQVPSTLTALSSFNGTNGANPIGGLVEDSNGNFFGTTQSGGANGEGAVFELAQGSNTITLLASFSNATGTFPEGGLIEDSSGNLFGTTENGGANNKGTVFELAHGSNTITVLASFNGTNGEFPLGSLVEDSSGNLFGTAELGGANNQGTVFELVNGSGTITALASFNNSSGTFPIAGLVEDSGGNLFGTAQSGGANSVGTVFELAHGSSTITALASFNNTNGAHPLGNLIADSNGNLFGMANSGGTSGFGAVFELAHGSSTITLLASLDNSTGTSPYGSLVEDSNGNLFGATENGGANNDGTVFELPQGSNSVTVLAPFNGTNGAIATGNLIEDSNGNLFGTAYSGGLNGSGTIFALSQRPSIFTQPQNATATVGQAASLSLTVAASGGTAPLSYQWQISTDNGLTFTNLSNGTGIGGVTTATLTLSGFSTPGSPEYRTIVTDASNATATSNAAILTINAAPAITTQPRNAAATVGQPASVSFSITDSGGSAPLTVHWQISTDNGATFANLNNGNGVTGVSTTTLTISGFTTAGSAQYQAVVNDANNVSATSNAATLTVNAAPSITTQPASQSATTGQTALESFRVVAVNGTAPWTYQWMVSTDGGSTFSNVSNGSGISGATTATLTIGSSALPASGTAYEVVVTDANGVAVTSTAASLTVNAAPAITTQPQNAVATVSQAASVSFSIADSGGSAPLTVHWQISTDNGATFTNLSDGNGVAGSNATTLTISGFTTAGSAQYQAVVNDANNVSATSNAATLTVNAAPSITTQPASQSATTGQTALESFRVVAVNGTAPWTYQWMVSTDGGSTFSNVSNGSGISGATTATLTIGSSALPASGTAYEVVVTDANGVAVTSTAASLTVNAAPAITTQPQNAVATVGQTASVSFSITDSGGSAPLTVQWQISTDNGATFTNLSDGNGVAGSNATTLTISGFTTAGSAQYQAVVSDANNVSATSNAATLTINAARSTATPNQSWLAQVYSDFFNRAVDPSGLATWSRLLEQGVSRRQVILYIQSGFEYRTDVVEALYGKLLHREADSSGLNAFTSFLGEGATAEQVEAAIIGSPEYFQLHGGTNASFLNAVYQDVFNRPLDASGAQSWGIQLASGTSPNGVARAILASLESDTGEVQNLFHQFLHRPADAAGLASFTTALQQGVTNEAAIAAIVGSEEYFARAQQGLS